jgi:hypothetical protein
MPRGIEKLSTVKSAGSWWTRLDNEPGFAREMSERQRSLSPEFGVRHHGGRPVSHELAPSGAWEADKDDPVVTSLALRAANARGEVNATVPEALAGARDRFAASAAVPVNLLIRHMEAHYGEYQLRHDLDCVLPLCATEKDRKAVREFARAKLAGRAYQGYGVTTLGKTCESCRKPFAARRSTARFCNAACRKRGSRRAA